MVVTWHNDLGFQKIAVGSIYNKKLVHYLNN
jgi:hypothetical protein